MHKPKTNNDIILETFTEYDSKGQRKLNNTGIQFAAIVGLCLTLYLLSYPFKKKE